MEINPSARIVSRISSSWIYDIPLGSGWDIARKRRGDGQLVRQDEQDDIDKYSKASSSQKDDRDDQSIIAWYIEKYGLKFFVQMEL